MSDTPQQWRPFDADPYAGEATVGSLVAYDYKPWRLISKEPASTRPDIPEIGGCFYFLLRPPELDPSPFERFECDKNLYGNKLVVLHDHYGLCTHCGELTPCRVRDAARIAAAAIEEMGRYETAGICPSCLTPVTKNQASETLPNIIAPLGPPVTFHAGRAACRYEMSLYALRLDRAR